MVENEMGILVVVSVAQKTKQKKKQNRLPNSLSLISVVYQILADQKYQIRRKKPNNIVSFHPILQLPTVPTNSVSHWLIGYLLSSPLLSSPLRFLYFLSFFFVWANKYYHTHHSYIIAVVSLQFLSTHTL